MGSWQFRTGFVVMYVLFALFLYFSFIQLLRVDMGSDKFHVSNYLKVYAYKYLDIEKIDEQNYFLFRLITIHLKSKGTLGKKLTFIPSYQNYEYFVEQNPDLFKHLLKND